MIACIKLDRPGSFSNTIRLTWLQTTSQKLPFTSSCKPPIEIFKWLINEMSTSSEILSLFPRWISIYYCHQTFSPSSRPWNEFCCFNYIFLVSSFDNLITKLFVSLSQHQMYTTRPYQTPTGMTISLWHSWSIHPISRKHHSDFAHFQTMPTTGITW